MSMYCGVDLHARSVQVCIINESGEKVKERRMATDLGHIRKVLEPYGLRAESHLLLRTTSPRRCVTWLLHLPDHSGGG
jgi:hypothetical protein